MKILFFCDVSGNLGDATRTFKNYEALRRLQNHVSLCNLHDYHGSKWNLLKRPSVLTSTLSHSKKNGVAYLKNEAYLTLAKDVLNRAIVQERPDVIFAEKQRCAFAASLNNESIPVIADLHGIWPAEYSEDPHSKQSGRLLERIREIETEVCEKASDVLVVSENMETYILDKYGVSEDKVTVLQNGSDLVDDKATFNKPLKVVYGGTFDFWEDLDTFLDLAKQDSSNEYFLFGEGPLKKHVLGRIDRERIELNYLGYKTRDDALSLFCKMNVGVAPSTKDVTRRVASPVKVYDYMACGLPVVTADCGEWAAHVEQSDCGFVTPNSRADEFLEAITMLQQKEVWEQKSENGREAVRKHYSWDKVLRPLTDVLAKY